MRLTGGSANRRSLKTPKGHSIIRPALAQVREAIFSSLGEVENKVFLDLYAGTGSLGLEALSRGAGFVYFVDFHPQALSLIIKNLEDLDFAARAQVFKRRLPNELSRLKIPHKIDVVFCDPPYEKGLLQPTLELLARQNYIDPQSLIIVEHTRREMPETRGLEVVKEKRFGQTLLTYLRPKTHDKRQE